MIAMGSIGAFFLAYYYYKNLTIWLHMELGYRGLWRHVKKRILPRDLKKDYFIHIKLENCIDENYSLNPQALPVLNQTSEPVKHFNNAMAVDDVPKEFHQPSMMPINRMDASPDNVNVCGINMRKKIEDLNNPQFLSLLNDSMKLRQSTWLHGRSKKQAKVFQESRDEAEGKRKTRKRARKLKLRWRAIFKKPKRNKINAETTTSSVTKKDSKFFRLHKHKQD